MSELLEELFGDYITTPYVQNNIYLLLCIAYTLLISVWMAFIYKKINTELTYNSKFALTLIMLSFVSTILLTLIQSNPLLSLGVLGSLHICRIRTNTKDPRDIGFVFWALAIGISSAIGAFSIGFIFSVILGIVLYICTNFKHQRNSLLMIIRGEKQRLQVVQQMITKYTKCTIQSKNVFNDSFELVYELHINENQEQQLLSHISTIEGISGVNILTPETKVA